MTNQEILSRLDKIIATTRKKWSSVAIEDLEKLRLDISGDIADEAAGTPAAEEKS